MSRLVRGLAPVRAVLHPAGGTAVGTSSHVSAAQVYPLSFRGNAVVLTPGGEGRHLLDLRMHLRTFGDFCMHRAMWIGASSPYLILPHFGTTYVLLHPDAAVRQVRQVLLGSAGDRDIALQFDGASSATGHYPGELPSIPIETALAMRDPLFIDLPVNDEEALRMAANAAAAFDLPPPPAPAIRREDGTDVVDADPSQSGACHPSFWRMVPHLLKAYEEHGPARSNFARSYATLTEEGELKVNPEGDHVVMVSQRRLPSRAEVLTHYGRETMTHSLAARAFTASDVDIEKMRWIEALLRDPRDISTPFPALVPFVKPHDTHSTKRILGNLVTREKATHAAALAFATRLSVIDADFWVAVVTHAAGGTLPRYELGVADPGHVLDRATALLDTPFSMKALRHLILRHLLNKGKK